jgi:hypothetical protein
MAASSMPRSADSRPKDAGAGARDAAGMDARARFAPAGAPESNMLQSIMQSLAHDRHWSPEERRLIKRSIRMGLSFYAAVIVACVGLAVIKPQPSGDEAITAAAADQAAAEQWQRQCHGCGLRRDVVGLASRYGDGGDRHAEIGR